MTNLVLIGDGANRTRITYDQSVTKQIKTYLTATFGVDGDGFMARDIAFENTAGPDKDQAVALRVSADMCVFLRVHIDGYQDSLYVQRDRQFYRDCRITGTVDFIFGGAVALLQNCDIIVRKPRHGQENMILASGKRDLKENGALILHNCRIKADDLLVPLLNTTKSFLGRPWKAYATHIIMFSHIDDLIDPAGWSPWLNSTFAQETCLFAELNNTGLGSNLSHRANWTGVKTGRLPEEYYYKFTALGPLMKGGEFIVNSGVPYTPGLTA